MITADSLTRIGTILKTHGVKGELTIATSYPEVLEPDACIVMEMDGIFVPFFITEKRGKSAESCRIIIDGFHSDTDAREVVGKTIYMPNDRFNALMPESDEEPDDGNIYLDNLIGFTLCNAEGETVGNIVDYDDSTANVLLAIKIHSSNSDSALTYIPFAADLFVDIDYQSRTLLLDIPQGLLDI